MRMIRLEDGKGKGAYDGGVSAADELYPLLFGESWSVGVARGHWPMPHTFGEPFDDDVLAAHQRQRRGDRHSTEHFGFTTNHQWLNWWGGQDKLDKLVGLFGMRVVVYAVDEELVVNGISQATFWYFRYWTI